MKKARAAAKKADDNVEPIREAGPVDRKAAVNQAVESVFLNLPQMMKGLIEQVKGGNPSAAKFLFEFAGVKSDPEEAEAPKQSAGQMFLDLLLAKKAESEKYMAEHGITPK
jgi:hypothetical protein